MTAQGFQLPRQRRQCIIQIIQHLLAGGLFDGGSDAYRRIGGKRAEAAFETVGYPLDRRRVACGQRLLDAPDVARPGVE